jgi:hypothetical protein
MLFTMTSWLVSGRPRQFMVIWDNSRAAGSGRPGVRGAQVPVGDVHPAHAARPEHSSDLIDG